MSHTRQIHELDENGYIKYTYSSVTEFKKATGATDSASFRKKVDGVHFIYADDYEQRQKMKELKSRLKRDLGIKEKPAEPAAEAKSEKPYLGEPLKLIEVEEVAPEDLDMSEIAEGLDPTDLELDTDEQEDETPAQDTDFDTEPVEAIDYIESRGLNYHLGSVVDLIDAAKDAGDSFKEYHILVHASGLLSRYMLLLKKKGGF